MDVRTWHIPSSLRVISVDASGTTAAFGECVMRANESGEEERTDADGKREGARNTERKEEREREREGAKRGFALSFRRGGL